MIANANQESAITHRSKPMAVDLCVDPPLPSSTPPSPG